MSPSYEGGQGGKGRIPSSILSEWKQPQQQAQSQSHHHQQQQQQQQQQIKSSRLSTSCPFIYSGTATAEIWPPRFYSCSFCRREFRSAQALGGHMNVHRRDRALLRRRSPPPPSSLEEDNPNNNYNNNDNSNNLHSDFPQPCKRSATPFHASTVTVASTNLAPLNSSFLNPSHSENPTAEGSSNYYYSSCRPSYLHSSFRSNPYSKDSSLPSNHIQTEEISVLHSSPMNLRPSHSDSSSTHHAPSRALCSPNELDLELRLGYSDLQSLPKNPP